MAVGDEKQKMPKSVLPDSRYRRRPSEELKLFWKLYQTR